GVAAIEQGGVATNAIGNQRGVSAVSAVTKTFLIAEIHIDVADAHLRSGALGAEGDGDTFVGLDVEDQAIGIDVSVAENDVRRALELDDDLGVALVKPLAGPQIKGHTGPAPVIDQDLHGHEGFGARFGTDALLLSVAGNGFAVDVAGGVLAANDGLRNHAEIKRTDGLQ